MQTITSRDNERVKAACKLRDSAAARRAEGLFFAEGARLCLDLAATRPPTAAFFTERLLAAHPEAAGLAQEAFLVQDHVAEKLAGTKRTQGLFCLFPLPDAGQVHLRAGEGLVVLENVQDPANVGAVLRSAAAFGWGGAVLLGTCADPFSPKAIRASVGACARLPIAVRPDARQALEELKGQGVQLVAAALEGAVPLGAFAPTTPFALLVGSEGPGLSPFALGAADAAVCIPMHAGVESLNAAVAAGVLLYELKRGV